MLSYYFFQPSSLCAKKNAAQGLYEPGSVQAAQLAEGVGSKYLKKEYEGAIKLLSQAIKKK